MHRFERTICLDNLNDLEVQGAFEASEYGNVKLVAATIGRLPVNPESLRLMNGDEATDRVIQHVEAWWRDEGAAQHERALREYEAEVRADDMAEVL